MPALSPHEQERIDALNVLFRVYGDLVVGRVYYEPDASPDILIPSGPNENFLSGGAELPFTLAVRRNTAIEAHNPYPAGQYYIFKHFKYLSLAEMMAHDILNEVMMRNAA